MPLSLTPDNILHKTLHDRFSTTRSSCERAMLALTLQAFSEVQVRRQETQSRVRELSLQVQRTESQIMRMHTHLFGTSRSSDSTLNGLSLDKYSLADVRVIDTLNALLGGQESRLRATKEELALAEQRLATLVTAWATKF
ncbi:hypothetical protein GGH12_005704 [Coemansia sp. RSA 1822]|nr:hypothetical protein LPJ76_004104 [Coemansia sp. RSA 638]KAJ2121717.1 hypothetical protein IW147_004034 [Coemansia sp. RSA 720]KAJ2543105.1 hypothetical protein GGF49_002352 [Coemansia sp. RSA 1853]KAJ2558779.1 hypothetical protein GGH12_005704 [Coemansia sp. RSA 1822]